MLESMIQIILFIHDELRCFHSGQTFIVKGHISASIFEV